MSIQTATNPMTGEEVTFAKGVVTRIYFNENQNSRFDWDKFRVRVFMGDTAIEAGNVKEERLPVKDSKGDYHDVEVGDEITCTVNVNGKYNNTLPKNIQMIKKGSGAPKTGGGKAAPQSKGVNVGMVAGNLRTVAFEFLLSNGEEITADRVNEIITTVAPIIKRTGEWLKEQRPDLDEYSVGASVGQSATISAKMIADINDLEANMQWILGDPLKHSEEVVEGIYVEGKTKTTSQAKKSPVATKKASKTPTKKAVDTAQEDVSDSIADLDDDIPF